MPRANRCGALSIGICLEVIGNDAEVAWAAVGIGSLNETPLHRALKAYIAPPGSRFEVDVDGYVIDVVAPDMLIEVQTRSVGKMRAKLGALLPQYRVRVVIPVAGCRWIVKSASDGAVSRRRSPKSAGLLDVFHELVSIPELLAHPNLEIEAVLTEETESRTHVAGKAWRRRGWVTTGRDLVAVTQRMVFTSPHDLLALLPAGLPAEFTTKDLSHEAAVPLRLAQRIVYCLLRLDLVAQAAKVGRLQAYVLVAKMPES